MRSPDSPRSSLSRRAVLASTAGVAAGLAGATGTAAAAQSPAATVMTQNAYLGFDVAELVMASSLAEVRDVAGGFLDRIEPDLYVARADSIAEAVTRADVDVLALQEAVLLRRQQPGDYGTESSEPATEVLVDFLDRIQTALAERGLDYTVAAETVTTDLELPAETDDGPVDLRLTDREALLVRSDLDTASPVTETYDTRLELPVPDSDRTLPITRGYAAADVTVDGVDFRAVSTHLESASPRYRRRQARELLDDLSGDRPVVVCGDLNSAPGDGAYDLLTRSLTDPYPALRPDATGYTCCQAKDLRNDRSLLGRRIDTLLYRGALAPTAIHLVGNEPSDRAAVEVDGETVRVWPSDHAGVVGTFELSASAAPATGRTPSTATRDTEATPTTSTPSSARASPAETPTESPTTRASGPGFGVVSTAAGFALGVGTWLRRRTQ